MSNIHKPKKNKQIKLLHTNRKAFYEALFDFDACASMYQELLMEIALSSWNYDGLPPTVDERFVEWCLYFDGNNVWFVDDVLGMLCLQVVYNGNLNVYRYPIKFQAYGLNNYKYDLDLSTGVIMFNNLTRTNTMLKVQEYARKLANIDMTIQVNANAQKTPYLIRCNEREKFSFKQIFSKLVENEPWIFGSSNLDTNKIEVLNLNAPYVSDKLYRLKTDIWNEALTYLGVSSVQFQKQERITNSEINTSLGGAFACRNSRLKAREQALEKVNRMFGTNITVRFAEPETIITNLGQIQHTGVLANE